MSTPVSSTRPLRSACLVLMVLGLLAAIYALALRVKAEASSRAVEIVVDYNEVIALAGAEGVLPNNVLRALKKAGATAVALPEETLDTLETQGEINITAHPNPIGSYPGGWVPTDQVFTVETNSPQAFTAVATGLERSYPAANLASQPPFRILVRGDRDEVSQIGLGLSGSKVDLIKSAGLRVIPRLHGSPVLTKQGLEASLDGVAQELGRAQSGQVWNAPGMVSPAKTDTQLGIVIFDGDTIPGYRALIPDLARLLTDRGLVYGAVEFAKQKGDTALGKALDGQLVRVHSISKEELATLTPGEAVARFGLAVKDRNIRVLYARIPPVVGKVSRVESAGHYIAAIKRDLTKSGFTVSELKQAHPFGRLALPSLLLALLFAGAGAAFFRWLLAVLPTSLPRSWTTVGFVLLALGVLTAVALSFVNPNLGRMGFGIVAAVAFPMLALTWAYLEMDRLSQAGGSRIWPAVRALLVATGITVLGGLLIAAMLTDARYLVKMSQFVGVKAALATPLLLFGLLLVSDGVARAGESVAAWWARITTNVKSFLAQPLYLWGIIAAGAALVVVALMLARSGNDGGVGVSDIELRVRAVLDQLLIARPRTKEFLLGHPLFLLGMAAALRKQRTLAMVLLVGGAIGQVDVLNTFCHAHTPVLLSLLRVVNGLWLGVIIGVVAIMLFYRQPKTPAR
jgi:hypothetical protein